LLVKDFSLYAVCTNYPKKLAKQIKLIKIKAGIYKFENFGIIVYLLVLKEISELKNNALWCMFSSEEHKILFGKNHYSLSSRISSTINKLFKYYHLEGFKMSYTMDDFIKETKEEFLQELSIDERLQGLSTDERLQGLSAKQIEEYLKNKKIH
jgi:hypothetical protein